MYDDVYNYLHLSDAEIAFLQTLERQIGIVADLSRADVLLYGRKSEHDAVVLAHARPHSLAHVYNKNQIGRVVILEQKPEIFRALVQGKRQRPRGGYISDGAPVVKQSFPVCYPPLICAPYFEDEQPDRPRLIAALVIVTNLIEHERHRLRSRVFGRALRKLQTMTVCGQLHGAEDLSPFGEQEGIIFADEKGIIRYASGIATNLYRKLGYKETLIGRHLSDLETEDEEIRRLAVTQNRCIEQETGEADRFWIRKALPLVTYPPVGWRWLHFFRVPMREKRYGVMITLHDVTESRRQDQEIQIKNAMIQEVHHRVKNNLQTIAGLLRMQLRRVKSEEARLVLDETLHRILSIAVIHEFLSNENSNIINIKELSHRIIAELQQGVLHPDKEIRLEVGGEPIYLPARQATACSLIINELLQNAIEHGFKHKQAGFVRVNLEDGGDAVIIRVLDNGDGLPGDFRIEQADSLGLQIVKILVEGDLRGHIQLTNGLYNGVGVTVTITFPKTMFGGKETWKEPVSL